MKELDVVKLLSDHKGILKGTEGIIVLDYYAETCVVEIFDAEEKTIDIVTTPKNLLEVICECPDME